MNAQPQAPRPSLDSADTRADYVAQLRAGMRRGAAAEYLGMGRFEVYAYIAEHPDFEREVLESEDAALENVEEALYQAAVTGNVRAAELWLQMHGRGKKPAAMPPTQSSGSQPVDHDDLESRLEALDR